MLLCLAIALGWQNISSSPDPTPPAPGKLLDYPDSFALQMEYLGRFSLRHHTVRQGDTLHEIFRKLGLPSDFLESLRHECRDMSLLDIIRPEDELTVYVRRLDDLPEKLVYASVDGSRQVFRRIEEGWECGEDSSEPFTLVKTVRDTIADNLYDSCVGAGMVPGMIMELADLFAYDVDFTSDIRQGDSFAVHFQEKVKRGKRVDSGPILAAEMVIGGRAYHAFLYTFSDGSSDYFDAGGNSLRKLFLKAPLSYRRISSTFTYKRFHPVLRIFRPHLGIDYAAPAGTPVSALGDGVLTYLGRKGGFGRFVEILHSGSHKTTYGHLSRYAKGLRKGSRVKQGDVIGYVGSSGLATGPHLDFRFYKDGRPVDFLKTDFPHALSIPKSMRPDFEKKRESYQAALRGGRFAEKAGERPAFSSKSE